MAEYTIGLEKLGIDLQTVSSTGYTTCPKCSHTRKTLPHQKQKVLQVNKQTGNYNCNHCDFKGRVDSNEWIEKQHQKDFSAQPQQSMKKEAIKPFYFAPLDQKAYDYLASRGISEKTAIECKLAYNLECLAFNYYKDGQIIGAKYRKLADKFFWQHQGCEKYLYGLDDIKGQDTIIIVEGEFDKLALWEVGFKNCVSVSQGAPNVGSDIGQKLKCLDNSIEYIKNAKRVIIACDNDPNGIYLTKILVDRFGADRCAVVEFPSGCKDANDVLMLQGANALIDCIQNAKDTPIEGVTELSEVREKMLDIFQNGYTKGVATGIQNLDAHFSFYKTWWNLFYGIPNSGKSAWVMYLMACMSARHGWKWACFVPEAYPAEDFYLDVVKVITGRGTEQYSKDRLTIQEFQIAMDFVEKHFFFVYPADYLDKEGKNMQNSSEIVISKIKELKLSKGIDGFLIDPFNQLTKGSGEKGTAKDEYLEEVLGKIDHLCKTHNLSGNITAHPIKQYKDKDSEDFKKPTPYDCAGGAMWYNKAYTITCVHRPYNQSDKDNTSVEIDIQKIKSHKRIGRPKPVFFNFVPNMEWYHDEKIPIEMNILHGFFDKLLQQQGFIKPIQSQNFTFTERMQASNEGERWDVEVPF